jgi:glycosyltransferase involved in cell wall biosynthesis
MNTNRPPKKKKILFIAEVGSIHVARWVNQLNGTNWEYRIFQPVPSSYGIRSEFKSGYFYLPYPINVPDRFTVEYTLSDKSPKSPNIFIRAVRKGYRILSVPISIVTRVSRKSLILLTYPISFITRVARKGLLYITYPINSTTRGLRKKLIERDLTPNAIYKTIFPAKLMLRERDLTSRAIYTFLLPNRFKPKEIDTYSFFPHAVYLAHTIKNWQPDVIHSLGVFVNWRDNAKILLLAREILGGKLPCPWIVSTWGADLDLYPSLGKEEHSQAKAIFSTCDGLLLEGERDLPLAKKLGFHGKVLAKVPAFGGVTWNPEDYCSLEPTSKRRVIILKGRDNTDSLQAGGDPQGRAMTAMKAFQHCQDILKPYSIVIVQATPAIELQAKILVAITGLNITVFPNTLSLPYEQWLYMLGAARIMIAVTISDGLPSTLVEAMSLGAFPIHSRLDTINEWIVNGKNGLLVPPEDVQAVARAINIAVTNDELVDKAAKLNASIITSKLSDQVIRPQVFAMYSSLNQRYKNYRYHGKAN